MSMKLSREKEHLILDNQRLVYYLVRNLGVTQNSSEYEDIVSIGTMGLVKAAITFDSSKKIAFATYASRCIKNEIFMHYRKANKYANDISIYEPIAKSVEGKELTLGETMEDLDSNFVEKIENKEAFIQLISIVLNCLEGKDRIVMLYRIGNISQKDIADIVPVSRSYISRIESRATLKIREIANHRANYKEVFSMSVIGDEYRISFSSKDIRKFNQIFATFLQNITAMEKLPDFKVSYNRERVVIQIPAHPESFSFIAQIIQEIDDFNMLFVSDKSTLSTDDTVIQEAQSDDAENRDDTVIQEAQPEGAENRDDTVIQEAQPDDAENRDVTVEESKPSAIEQKQDVTSDAVNETDKKGGQIKQIRDYMLSMSSFTVKDLRNHFPDLTVTSINNAVYLAKSKGLITATGRGKYIVNKN